MQNYGTKKNETIQNKIENIRKIRGLKLILNNRKRKLVVIGAGGVTIMWGAINKIRVARKLILCQQRPKENKLNSLRNKTQEIENLYQMFQTS